MAANTIFIQKDGDVWDISLFEEGEFHAFAKRTTDVNILYADYAKFCRELPLLVTSGIRISFRTTDVLSQVDPDTEFRFVGTEAQGNLMLVTYVGGRQVSALHIFAEADGLIGNKAILSGYDPTIISEVRLINF